MCAQQVESKGDLICGRCQSTPRAFTTLHCASVFSPLVSPLIYGLKRHHDKKLLKPMTKLMLNRIDQSELLKADAIVPVPMHVKTKIKRGYNQALLLAKALSNQCHLPCIELLDQHKPYYEQKRFNANKRELNAKNAFSLIKGLKDLPERILLVDDVSTTTATMHNCAKTLRKSGVTQIQGWAFSRVL